jgi:hypothetical protein
MRCSVALALLLLDAAFALTCDCKPPPPPKKALEAAAAVFLAEVVSIDDAMAPARLVTLKAEKSWKGIDGEKIVVSTSKSGASCGYPFQKGQRYLVYAYAGTNGGPLHVSLCSRTRTAKEAEASDDFKELGEGKAIESDPLSGMQLRLEIEDKEYDPAKGSKGKLRLVLKNDSVRAMEVPALYDGNTVVLKSANLTLQSQAAMRKALKGEAVKSASVGPGEERQLLELPLDTILMRDGMGSGDWRWDWPRRPAPPVSPIFKARKGGFVDRAMFQAEFHFGDRSVRSNVVALKVTQQEKP